MTQVTLFSCSYCGAVPRELAVAQGMDIPAEVHVVEFPCISRVQSDVVLAAFEAGADGVLLVGCEEGNCHHQGGNARASRRFQAMQDFLEQIGLGRGRLALWQTGLGQPSQFRTHVNEFVQHITELGQSPLKSGGSAGD
ncbi:MAG: hydrogenase iron-sulfur subunit [Anaerolineae bacterium]|nr:hydrogenase iron-sulfur subunit [Anaerolineae bacterium]